MTTIDVCIVLFTIAMSVCVFTSKDGIQTKTMERFALGSLWVMMTFIVIMMVYLVYIY